MSTRFVTFASVISEIEQSDIFMTVRARILETPKANLNGCRVTNDFVDNIISNKERYVGLPLYADKKALVNGNYNRLGHLYDSRTGEFHSTQIGSFYDFEKEDFENGSYLVGYARIPKRDKEISKAIAELFADGALKFSFEIACGEYSELEDGTIEIDASENNYLEGTAIVTFPACEDAVALEFVAQRSDDTRKGDEEMAEENIVAETATPQTEAEVETTEEVAETTEKVAETTEEVAETVEAEETAKTAETDEAEEAEETAACGKEEKEKAEENAEVYVTESYTEQQTVDTFDTDTGETTTQTVTVETRACYPIAEEVSANEETSSKMEETIAELVKTVENLTAEIQALKKTHISAEVVNPFMGDVSVDGPKYSLLEKDSHGANYSLLSK